MYARTKSVEKDLEKEKRIVQSAPEPVKGVNLVDKPEGFPALQILVSEQLSLEGGEAVWIDSRNRSSTYALSSAGGATVMENVRIGRAFTPFQHYDLIHGLEGFVDERTELLVMPQFSFHYLEGQLNDREAEELFTESWSKVMEIQEKYDLKVLVTLPEEGDSRFCFRIRSDSENKLEIQKTSRGMNYSSDSFETHFYRENGFLQTTIPYWEVKGYG